MSRMKAGERRDVIVSTAIRLFAKNGFRGTTTRELALAAGVTEPVLYQHFRAKSDLYDAIIETKSLEGGQIAERLLGPYLDRDDDEGFFRALAELILSRFESDPDYTRLLLFSALEGHDLAALFFDRQLRGFYRLVAGYIRRRIRQGAFRPMDANIAARAFLGMVNHHGLVKVLFHDTIVRASRKRLIHQMVQTFLLGVSSNRKKNV
jgi:TetR/AcrR family transcriptional regulator